MLASDGGDGQSLARLFTFPNSRAARPQSSHGAQNTGVGGNTKDMFLDQSGGLDYLYHLPHMS